MCRFFEVSRSGYYDYVKLMSRPEKDAELAEEIRILQQNCFDTYGYRRMWMVLEKKGIRHNSKTILDLFTAMVFACSAGIVVSIVALPQLVVFLILFALAKLIVPLTTPSMINDFKVCGGFLLVATGLRIAKIKDLPLADMLPAMVLVMPLNALWTSVIAPLLA